QPLAGYCVLGCWVCGHTRAASHRGGRRHACPRGGLRRRVIAGEIAALLLILGILAVLLARQRMRRHRYFRAAPAEARKAPPPVALGAIEQWSDQFRALETTGKWKDLAELLDESVKKYPQLQYLRARAYIESDQPKLAMQSLAPFLANGNPFRNLALFHRAELEGGEAASRD